jgi:hypothetical protein
MAVMAYSAGDVPYCFRNDLAKLRLIFGVHLNALAMFGVRKEAEHSLSNLRA